MSLPWFAATGSWDNSVLLYSVESACVVTTIDDAHDALVSALDLAHGGGAGARDASLCTGAWDATVKLWRLAPSGLVPHPLLELYEHESPVTSLRVAADGNVVIAGAEDGRVVLWDVRAGGAPVASFSLGEPVTSLCWSDGAAASAASAVLVASSAGTVAQFAPDGRRVATVSIASEARCVCADGPLVVAGAADASLTAWAWRDDGSINARPAAAPDGLSEAL